MDPSIVNIVISAVGGLCCCVFWIAVIGGIAYFMMGRNKGDEEEGAAGMNKALDDKPDFSADAADAPAAAKVEATPGPSEDEEEDPEDAATVIATQPVTPAAAKKPAPKAEPPKPEPKKPAPRTSGATIIAFDDDFDDDDE